ncbi:alpha/beta hydrolase [Acetobacterium bakii]|uniref:Alpha/beta hydrolase fold-3 domain-containing protein n=1 Tax=Acetobacterium bakii TaxID=52689 RepID=A0A0L6TZ28_9FIRM|nr:alpha/beta hydrolase [Acetobacterium bakii]KNZ41503.1 hypothetical protein AKG39_10920 [Acetobacterium bakii]
MHDVEYGLHKDLAGMEKAAFPNFNITPFVIKVINAVGTVSVALTRLSINKRKLKISGADGGKFYLTIYEPQNCIDTKPCLLYFHGGAFVFRDFGYMHKKVCKYATESACKIVFVHYRLAPKYPSNVLLEDSYSSLEWVFKHSKDLGIDPNKIAVGGDSAGGALAAAVTQMTRDRKGPKICFQMLIYPVTDAAQKTASIKSFDNTPGWNANLNKQMWNYYLKNTDPKTMKYVSPMSNPSFENLPDAYVEVEEFDCLRDEGIAYAQKLMDHGANVKLNYIKGTFHGFDINLKKGVVIKAVNARIKALREAFS